MAVPRRMAIRTADTIRVCRPNTPEFWNVMELARHADAAGLKLTSTRIAQLVAEDHGPPVCALAGCYVLFTPDDGRKWVAAEVDKRELKARQRRKSELKLVREKMLAASA